MTDKAEGYVDHIIYRNEDNGYSVIELSSGQKKICCVGILGSVSEGEYLKISGGYIFHSVYGRQFKIENYSSVIPREKKALERYLGSGAIKGIGASLAARIVDYFGDDTLHVIENEPERLSEIKGISDRKARDVAVQMEDKSKFRNEIIFLTQYGISLNLCFKIHQKYREELYTVLQNNPYRLAEDIDGVGFATADKIAAKIGIRKDSPYRIKSAYLYVLNRALSRGDIFLPEDILTQKTSELLGVEKEDLRKHFTDLIIEKKIIAKHVDLQNEGNVCVCVYTYKNYFLELRTAALLAELNSDFGDRDFFAGDFMKIIEKHVDIKPDPMQIKAVKTAAENGIFILTGGPGTGKTTTINLIIKYFESSNKTIFLAAPTGKAAKRMTEATGYEAMTIHRMLELYGDPENPAQTARFGRNHENPLEADVIIIDETSMIDLFLMNALLEAVLPGTRLIFVGDVNQLPSVGPGTVLKDMIDSGRFPVIKLSRIFRQAAKSNIVLNAHMINAGEKLDLENKQPDFFFLKRANTAVAQKVVVSLVNDKLPSYFNIDRMSVQVLTPMRKGPLGVENLNVLMQKYLNPPSDEKKEYEYGGTVFRVGDKVMQIKNNYQLEWEIRGKYDILVEKGTGVFNGDCGIISKIDSLSESLFVTFDDCRCVEYSFKQVDEIELAYALTIHKAQGSEYPAVVIPLLGVPVLLKTRKLLYTAVTRAKYCVAMTGDPEIVDYMIENKEEELRFGTLKERIKEFS